MAILNNITTADCLLTGTYPLACPETEMDVYAAVTMRGPLAQGPEPLDNREEDYEVDHAVDQDG